MSISTLPRESNSLCWNCCHHFGCHPVLLPSSSIAKPFSVVFRGNFCSFNCAKSYHQGARNLRSKGETTHILTMMAFLMYHRPVFCPMKTNKKHSCDCPCLNIYHGIPLAEPKETLISFGGEKTIQEYRRGFLTIQDYTLFEYYMLNKTSLIMSSIKSTVKEQQTEEDNKIKPVVHKKTLKYKKLLT